MATLRKTAKTGLKATAYTEILNLQGRGALRGIYWVDVDNASQNETLRIKIDGETVLDAAKDLSNSAEFLNLLTSIASNTLLATTDEHVQSEQKIPFHDSCIVEYKRAAAQSTGLSITFAYTLKDYFS